MHFDPDDFFQILAAASALFAQNTASSTEGGIEQIKEVRKHSIPSSLKSLNCEKKY